MYWLKVYHIPQASRTSAGRSIANVLSLKPDEKITSVIPVREFGGADSLLMGTRNGIIKKTSLMDYSRPRLGGIIGINIDEGDQLIGVVRTLPGDQVILNTRLGMSIRFDESDAREMGRNTRGVKGISLSDQDEVVGLTVADPQGYLLTVCEHGYGKRTPFGANVSPGAEVVDEDADPTIETVEVEPTESDDTPEVADRSSMRYRLQRRGGKGVRDIRTTARNGPVVGVCSVREGDEIMLITVQGW